MKSPGPARSPVKAAGLPEAQLKSAGCVAGVLCPTFPQENSYLGREAAPGTPRTHDSILRGDSPRAAGQPGGDSGRSPHRCPGRPRHALPHVGAKPTRATEPPPLRARPCPGPPRSAAFPPPPLCAAGRGPHGPRGGPSAPSPAAAPRLTLLPQRSAGLAAALLPPVTHGPSRGGEGRQRVLALLLRLSAQLLGRAADAAASARLARAAAAGPAGGVGLGARRAAAGPAAPLAPAAAAALFPPGLGRPQHLEGVGLVIKELVEAVGDDAAEALLQVSGHDGPPSAGSCSDAAGPPAPC